MMVWLKLARDSDGIARPGIAAGGELIVKGLRR